MVSFVVWFCGINYFAVSFEDNTHQIRHTWSFLLKVEIKNYNAMIDGQKFFDQSVKNDPGIYNNI